MSTNSPSPPYDIDTETDLALSERATAELDAIMFNLETFGEELDGAWKQFLNGAVDADIHENAPLKLEDAICLPELAGIFTVNPDLRKSSSSLSVKTLRLAIERGELSVIRPNSKNLYVTRRAIREWLEKCQDQKITFQFSSSEKSARTKTGASRTKPNISSTKTTTSISLESARMILNQLKQPSVPSSPSDTRKK